MTEKRAHHVKWLKFAILLSQVKFDELTEGQRLDLGNEFRAFLKSMPDATEKSPVRSVFRVASDGKVTHRVRGHSATGKPIDATYRIETDGKKEKIDLEAAQEALKEELDFLSRDSDVFALRRVEASIALVRFEDTFDYSISANKHIDQIRMVLGYHLQGSGILPSMLRTCPQCKKLFLASRKPRPDRKFHCSTRCSSNAASATLRRRKKLLAKAKKLFKDGESIDAITKITGLLDRAWLAKKLRRPQLRPAL